MWTKLTIFPPKPTGRTCTSTLEGWVQQTLMPGCPLLIDIVTQNLKISNSAALIFIPICAGCRAGMWICMRAKRSKIYKVKKYPHFDNKIHWQDVRHEIENPDYIVHHAFYPFIHYVQEMPKYPKTIWCQRIVSRGKEMIPKNGT